MRAFLQSILPFEAQQAAEAAWMFQSAGRPRRLRVDTMIAACAKLANARLATSNADDFRPFEALGLQLVR
jgi:predicted nucleic acid-binding protein